MAEPLISFRTLDPASISRWQPSIGEVCDSLQRHQFLEPGPLAMTMLGKHMLCAEAAGMMNQKDRTLQYLMPACTDAIDNGRLIDFGFLSAELMLCSVKQATELMDKRHEFEHPFQEPYLIYHSYTYAWDAGTIYTNLFMVRPKPTPGCTWEIIGLDLIKVGSGHGILIGDQVYFSIKEDNSISLKAGPGIARLQVAFAQPEKPKDALPTSIFYDYQTPLLTALLISNTPGVKRTTVTATEKQKKVRARSGRLPMIPYEAIRLPALSDPAYPKWAPKPN